METSAQAVGYHDWLADPNNPTEGAYNNSPATWDSFWRTFIAGDNLVGNTVGKLIGQKGAYQDQYNKYVEAINKANEERALANARAYNEWYDSTKYQRLVADLKKAGLNPWLALNGSFGTESPSNATPSSAKGVEFSVKETKGSLAALLGALAKLIAG